LRRRIDKSPRALIAVENIVAIAGDIEILIAIVVVVGSQRAHRISRIGDPRRCGALIKATHATIAEERARARRIGEVEVEPGIVVVVEEGHARAHRLRQQLLTLRAIAVEEVNTRLHGRIDKARLGLRQPPTGQNHQRTERDRLVPILHPRSNY